MSQIEQVPYAGKTGTAAPAGNIEVTTQLA
jgi:cell division protein FtsI/penicillin-binding protein 2